MQKLSVLIMTRNNTKTAINLIEDLKDIADEFVIIESSEGKDKNLIKKYSLKNRKVSIYDSVALGYQDPLRMYGLSKCENEWVLHLDVDERLSSSLKTGLKSMINTQKVSAFSFRRYEHVENNNHRRTSFFTWQVRLFKKSKIVFHGLIHEAPIINGHIYYIKDKEKYVEHVEEFKVSGPREYSIMHKLDRLSYAAYNDAMLEYLAKFTKTDKKKIKKTFAGRVLISLILLYERITLKKYDKEISNFDYFFYNLFKSVGYAIMMKSPMAFIRSFENATYESRRIKEWRREPDAKELFELSKIIRKIGIIKFLNLDKEETVKIIYNKYKGKKQGISLLLHLLIEQYKKQ